MTETFYDVLGVAEDATTDEIETAYRERLKETHPDVSDDEDAGQETKTLIEARDVLVDEAERARYDRLGHDAYVAGDAAPSVSQSSDTAADARSESDEEDGASDAGDRRSQDRGRRERRASERVREERRRAREARQERRERGDRTGGESEDSTAADATVGTATTGGDRVTGRQRSQGATVTEATYSVREEVAAPTSQGPLLPQGRQLTLLGIFFALYPVLLFSALLPAFPLFVNFFLGACVLLMITYVQSMPRVALALFGGWSALSVVGVGLFGIGYLSPVGLVALSSTLLPFGFSVLTASALRY